MRFLRFFIFSIPVIQSKPFEDDIVSNLEEPSNSKSNSGASNLFSLFHTIAKDIGLVQADPVIALNDAVDEFQDNTDELVTDMSAQSYKIATCFLKEAKKPSDITLLIEGITKDLEHRAIQDMRSRQKLYTDNSKIKIVSEEQLEKTIDFVEDASSNIGQVLELNLEIDEDDYQESEIYKNAKENCGRETRHLESIVELYRTRQLSLFQRVTGVSTKLIGALNGFFSKDKKKTK